VILGISSDVELDDDHPVAKRGEHRGEALHDELEVVDDGNS
jgi:hypothetical protein